MAGDVLDEALQRHEASRPAEQAAVQAHRHHARDTLALGVEEPTLLDHQRPGVGAGASGVPPQRSAARCRGEGCHGLVQVGAFGVDVDVLVVDPAVAVAADLVAGGDHAHREDGQWQVVPFEQVEEPELATRPPGWQPLPPRYPTGVLGKYAKLVQGAESGAITNTL